LKPFDANGAFLTPADSSGLRRLAVRGAGVTVLSQGMMLAVQLIATVVLARLLKPSDFGLVAMVTTFSLFLASVGQIGFQEAVLQREEIDHSLASNLFWINLGTGIVLTVGFAAAGSLLARLYGDARVAHVAIGFSLTILLTSVSVLHLALLKRAMRFSAVSAINVLARTVSVAVPILLAWAGWGYWALAVGAVAQALAISIAACILCPWVPSFPRHIAGTASMVWFAARVNGRWNLNYFSTNMDNLLVGWRFGAGPLGFYKRAYDLFALPASQFLSVFPVAVSALSRLNRDPVRYRRYFLGGLSVLALVGMAAGAELTLVGKDLVRLLLGPGWEASGRIFTFFGPGIGLMVIYGTHGMIHLSLGTPSRWFRWGIIECTVTGLLFLLALPWGPVGIAAAWSASFWILLVPAFWYAGKPIQLGITPVLTTVWKYLVASLMAGCTCALILRAMPSMMAAPGWFGALARIVTMSIIFGILYIGAVILLHRGCAPLRQFAGHLREIIPWEMFSKSSLAVGAACPRDAGLIHTPTSTGDGA
jgi:O-antigen/teichoic acid export membrane protein